MWLLAGGVWERSWYVHECEHSTTNSEGERDDEEHE
jgi:hypothetical protein